MKKNEVQFKVTAKLPEGVTKTEMAGYVREAVRCWRGGKHPDDPLFDLDWRTVRVKPHKEIPAIKFKLEHMHGCIILFVGYFSSVEEITKYVEKFYPTYTIKKDHASRGEVCFDLVSEADPTYVIYVTPLWMVA